MKKSLLIILLPLVTFGQERIDEKPPEIKIIYTLNSMVGWTKNDLGKWSSSQNALPQYAHSNSGFSPNIEHIQKIELAEIKFNNTQYYCLAKFGIYPDIKNGTKHTVYPVEFWLFNPSQVDTLIGQDLNVMSLCYATRYVGHLFGSIPANWKKISDEIVVKSNEGPFLGEKLCIQFRQDNKNKKDQFLIGGLISDIEQFHPATGWTIPGENNELKNSYYEVPMNVFETFLSKIK